MGWLSVLHKQLFIYPCPWGRQLLVQPCGCGCLSSGVASGSCCPTIVKMAGACGASSLCHQEAVWQIVGVCCSVALLLIQKPNILFSSHYLVTRGPVEQCSVLDGCEVGHLEGIQLQGWQGVQSLGVCSRWRRPASHTSGNTALLEFAHIMPQLRCLGYTILLDTDLYDIFSELGTMSLDVCIIYVEAVFF